MRKRRTSHRTLKLARQSSTPPRVMACAALSGRQGRRGARRDAGTSGKRLDAPCRPDSAARRVAPGRPPAASRASTVGTATLFGPLLAGRTPGRDASRDSGVKGKRKSDSWGVSSSAPAGCRGVGLGGAVGNWLGAATGDESGGDKPVIHSGRRAPKPFLPSPAITIRPSSGADPRQPAAGSGDPACGTSSRGC